MSQRGETQEAVLDGEARERASECAAEGESAADMYDVAINHTMLFSSYLKSRRYKKLAKEGGQGAVR